MRAAAAQRGGGPASSPGEASSSRSPPRRPENIVHQTMNTSTPSAASASSKSHPIQPPACAARRPPPRQARSVARAAGPGPARGHRGGRAGALLVLGLALLACAAPPRPGGAVAAPAGGAAASPGAAPASRRESRPAETTAVAREGSVWRRAEWRDLPGWPDPALHEAWPALRLSCRKPAPGWAAACASALALGPSGQGPAGGAPDGPDAVALRAWAERWLQPWRVEAARRPEGGDPAVGLLTGYFEPLLEGRRQRAPGFEVPLHRPPAELGRRKPWYSRAEMARLPEARAALAGREIAWLADPLDLLLVQVQGSGRLRLLDEAGPDGAPRTVRLAFAGHNDQAYVSVGRWLVERGELRLEQASWPGIRAWAQAHPDQVTRLVEANPRVVFFREEPLPDPSRGPLGAQGLPLTPGRSIAVDKTSLPYGTPVWLASTEPAPWPPQGRPPPPRPLQRLVVAQDTGGAIVGAVRADYFAGWGPEAEDLAGRLRQPLRLWALWPRESPPPR